MAVELTEAQINGRFQLVDRPLAAPGKCAVCGAVDRPVLDFGFDLDDYGVVYICVDDFKAGALLLGLVDVSQLVQPSLPEELQVLLNEYLDSVARNGLLFRINFERIMRDNPSSSSEKSGNVQTVDGPEPIDDSPPEQVHERTTEQDSELAINQGAIGVSSSGSNGLTLFEFPA
jgi:hypothetical protein